MFRVSSALKEVEAFVNLGFVAGQIQNGSVFVFFWDEAGFALSTKVRQSS
jgi:hypothetical protein